MNLETIIMEDQSRELIILNIKEYCENKPIENLIDEVSKR